MDRTAICPGCGYLLVPVGPSSDFESAPPATKRKPLIGWAAFIALLYISLHALFFEVVAGGWRPLWAEAAFLAFMLISLAALLKIPVQIETRRPVKRTALWIPILMSGFFMGLVVLGFAITLPDLFSSTLFDQSGAIWSFGALGLGLLTWVAWSIVFWRMSRTASPSAVVGKQNRTLLRGSILEFLVAVPTYVIARHRDECCAGVASSVGIWLGVSIALLAFGPSLFFLYAAKWRSLKRRPPATGIR